MASACFGAPCDEILHAFSSLDRQLLGLCARFGDDGGGARFRFGRLPIEARQQRRRFLAQLHRLGELGGDRLAARVERIQNHAMNADIDEDPDKDEEAKKDENFPLNSIMRLRLRRLD